MRVPLRLEDLEAPNGIAPSGRRRPMSEAALPEGAMSEAAERIHVPGVLRVLLVEDDPSDVLILTDQLARCRALRFDVAACSTLEQALRHEALPTADVVLLDLGLPDSVGLTTCRRFLADGPPVPVLVLTGMHGESLGVEAVKQGAQDFLPKASTDPEALGRAIRHAVERHAMLHALRQAASDARAREHGLRRLLERSVEALVVVTEDGTVRFANRAAGALLGRDVAALEGTPWTLGLPELAAATPDRPREILLARPGGSAAPAEVRAVSFEWEGAPARLVSLLDLADRRRAERLALAQMVQRSFLPESATTAIGCIEAAALNELCEDVSGDFYDFIHLPDGRLLVALGDVTGHGLGAALLMAQAHAALRAFASSESDLGLLLSRMNRAVEGDACQGSFLTLFLALVDPKTAQVAWSSAGHPLAARVDREGVARPLAATAPPLWVDPGTHFPVGEPFSLEEGEGLLVFSDGAVEIPDGGGRHLGIPGLLDSFATHWAKPTSDAIRRVREDLRAWGEGRPLPDDLTLLALRRTSGAPTGC